MMKKVECRSAFRSGASLGLILVIAHVSGCASSPVPELLRRQAALQPSSFVELKSHAESYRDRMVILGGDIVQSRHLGKTSEIEVVQKSLDSADRPEQSDSSGGRFLAECPYFVDPTIYEKDRELTVAGKVLGKRAQKLDEAEYDYLVVGCDYLHLWPERQPAGYYSYPYAWYGWGWPYYYYPYSFYYPYYPGPMRAPVKRR
ncbi:Slp family lipoprotein [Methylococcus mesophilus]|uniref:Slp family lipoprotein n=1 Tax=Methylococcus mesophilus TaxID=2993564 RepID=UPI00224A4F95|nr:Slp family lipoprotein [Methylococcus mesophilus]UZR28906.1 Slp family lipoprotein [Methylococcus mesophilus]